MLDMAQPIQMLLKDLLFQNKTNVIAPLYFSFKPAPNRFFERFKVKNSTSEEEIIHEGKVIFSHKREFLSSWCSTSMGEVKVTTTHCSF